MNYRIDYRGMSEREGSRCRERRPDDKGLRYPVEGDEGGGKLLGRAARDDGTIGEEEEGPPGSKVGAEANAKLRLGLGISGGVISARERSPLVGVLSHHARRSKGKWRSEGFSASEELVGCMRRATSIDEGVSDACDSFVEVQGIFGG